MRRGTVYLGLFLMAAVALGSASQTFAAHVVQIPISASMRTESGSAFNVIVMNWDQEGAPNPLRLLWGHSQVPVRGKGLEPLTSAFAYALDRIGPLDRPTGTLSLSTLSGAQTSSEGSSAGAALAVGFLAVLKGVPLHGGMALIGTLEPTGRIGAVPGIDDKMKAAARAGYRTLLVPRGQLRVPRINLIAMGRASNLLLREVGTVEEAYEIMTGKKL